MIAACFTRRHNTGARAVDNGHFYSVWGHWLEFGAGRRNCYWCLVAGCFSHIDSVRSHFPGFRFRQTVSSSVLTCVPDKQIHLASGVRRPFAQYIGHVLTSAYRKNYRKPLHQRYVVRILLMLVFVFGKDDWKSG